jgi:hypothetical protein
MNKKSQTRQAVGADIRKKELYQASPGNQHPTIFNFEFIGTRRRICGRQICALFKPLHLNGTDDLIFPDCIDDGGLDPLALMNATTRWFY